MNWKQKKHRHWFQEENSFLLKNSFSLGLKKHCYSSRGSLNSSETDKLTNPSIQYNGQLDDEVRSI